MNFNQQLEWDKHIIKRIYNVFEKHPIDITYIVDLLEKYADLIDFIGPEVFDIATKEFKERRGL